MVGITTLKFNLFDCRRLNEPLVVITKVPFVRRVKSWFC